MRGTFLISRKQLQLTVFVGHCRLFSATSQCSAPLTPEEEDDHLVRQLIQMSDFDVAKGRATEGGASSSSASFIEIPAALPPVSEKPAASPSSIAINDVEQARQLFLVRRTPIGLEWQCTACTAHNPLARTTCRKCRALRSASNRAAQPTPSRHIALLPTQWYCNVGTCRHLNDFSTTQEESGEPKVTPRQRYFCQACTQPFHGVHDWICRFCASANAAASTQCGDCFSTRSLSWKCPLCREERNSIFSASCASCSYTRAARQQQSAGATLAMVSCSQCGASNQSYWEVCGSCLSPLPTLLSSTGPTTIIPSRPKRLSPSIRENPITPAHRDEQHSLSPPPAPAATTTKPEPARDGNDVVVSTTTRSSWQCYKCGLSHRHQVPFCDICLIPREDSLARARATSAWACVQCGTSNEEQAGSGSVSAPDRQRTCKSCGYEPTNSIKNTAEVVSISTALKGYWTCNGCKALNQPLTRTCASCSQERQMPSGYWQCEKCMSVNRDARLVCIGCCDTRPRLSGGFGRQRIQISSGRGQSWTCTACSAENQTALTRCQSCKTERAFWVCRCGASNNLSSVSCSRCSAARKLSSLRCAACFTMNSIDAKLCSSCGDDLEHTRWTCLKCGCAENDLRQSAECQKCGSCEADDPERNFWLCGVCHSVNITRKVGTSTKCPRCLAPRPVTSVSQPTKWTCGGCSRSNFIATERCVECDLPRCAEWNSFVVDCTSCQKSTLVTQQEECSHCGNKISDQLSRLLGKVIYNDADEKRFRIVNRRKREATTTSDTNDNNDTNVNVDPPSEEEDIVALDEELDADDLEAISEVVQPATTTNPAATISTVSSAEQQHRWACSLCGEKNALSSGECYNCGMPKNL